MSTNRFLSIVSGVQTLFTAIATSVGAGDANKIVMTGSNGRLDNSLMPVGLGAATETIIASETLAAGDFVNIFDNAGTRNVRKADASNNRTADGFVVSAVTSGQNATVTLQGLNTALTSLTIGAIYYLSASTPGTATTTAPNTSGQIIQYLGKAISTTAINYERDQAISIQ